MVNNKHRQSMWLCKCECGIEKIILGNHLKSGHTKSCGCLHKEIMTKHGHSKNGKRTRTYQSWHSMIKRCVNPNDPVYHNYGGRSIKVCKRWMQFENFLEDMGEVSDGYQIDRINNNENYCKSNCHWVTPKTNSRNKRDNHLET